MQEVKKNIDDANIYRGEILKIIYIYANSICF
jgi:hypothetical protein